MVHASPRSSRSLDHLVLPVADLETARTRYEALGFTVAPDATHPFGTENACVFLPDGSYLEPLAIAQRETCEAQARAGNVFVARDQAFRFRRGQEGFSAVVLESDDADFDDRSFRDAGISAGDTLGFSRLLRTPEGAEEEMSFKLAFAADLRAPDAFFFTCHRVDVSAVDRTVLQRHPNGVSGIRSVVAVEPNPSDFQYLLQSVLGQRDVNAHSFGIELAMPNATLSVLTPDGFRAFFGASHTPCGRGLRFAAIVLAVPDLSRLNAVLSRNAVSIRRLGGRLIIDPAPGQGVFLAFEEARP